MAFFGLKSDIFRSFSSERKIEYSSGACPKMSCQPRQRRFFSSDKAPGVCAGPQKRRIRGRLRGPRRRIPPPSHAVNARDARRTLCLLAPTAPFAKGSCQHAVLTEGSDSIRRRRLVILRENKIRARSLRALDFARGRPLAKAGSDTPHILRRISFPLCSAHIFSLSKGLTVNLGWFTIIVIY